MTKAAFLMAALMSTVAMAVTPANGGMASGSPVAVDTSAGDQTEPHVSGDLAVYTNKDFVNGNTIHYFSFAGGAGVVPTGMTGDNDNLSDVNGSKIAFSRTRVSDGKTACMVYDVVANALTEIAPVPAATPMTRFGTVLGGNSVAFQDFAVGNGDVMVVDMSTNVLSNVSNSMDSDGNPSLAPSGNAVVWERCIGSNCGIYRSVKGLGGWGGAELLVNTTSNEGNPDTDGTNVVYDSDRPSLTGKDIYYQPLMGGAETTLQLAGDQQNPSINSGVIAFESHPGASWDLYVYIIATNTLYQVTNTPGTDEVLNDVTVLGGGAVRIVWAQSPVVGSPDHDIWALTFTPPPPPDPQTEPGCDHDKVAVCHIPPGNPNNKHTIHVSQSAVAAHLGHGDSLGECTGSSNHHLDSEPQPQTGCSATGGLAPMVAGLILLALVLRRRPAEVRSRRR